MELITNLNNILNVEIVLLIIQIIGILLSLVVLDRIGMFRAILFIGYSYYFYHFCYLFETDISSTSLYIVIVFSFLTLAVFFRNKNNKNKTDLLQIILGILNGKTILHLVFFIWFVVKLFRLELIYGLGLNHIGYVQLIFISFSLIIPCIISYN